MPGQIIDLTGQKFEKLTAVKIVEIRKGLGASWLCKCECGNTKIVLAQNLKKGVPRSCGCLHTQIARTPLYKVWSKMKRRCFNLSDAAYHNYGARGITVCGEWTNDFTSFYKWCVSNMDINQV